MSYDQSCPLPQVFLVDSGRGPEHSLHPPNLVPCWSFPPAQERARSRGRRGCMGVNPGLLMVLLFLMLLLFAALGLGAYQIRQIQEELTKMRQNADPENEFLTPEKQIGRIQTEESRKTLRWEPQAGRAFTTGGVVYRVEDGALQVNDTGLYHIYSRVELLFKHCSLTDSFVHSVFVRRVGHPTFLTLMEGQKAGFCSQRQGHVWTSDSYLGSVLQLQKQDKVFVNVSYPIYLSHQYNANFFGLYKI
ncbi:tumor necrosis factor ligand superfamily member 6 [Diretmus argenteus]